jgi:TetR/AcrR family transcriptional regulator, regulator of autoinduction and epiphytic fitness
VSDELDPRIERSRRLITEAALEEMADAGYGAMTVEGIAKRACVSKATIYRHWSGKLEIVEAALEQLKSTMIFDHSAPPRARLTQLLTWLADYVGNVDDSSSACVPAMVSAAQYDPAVREFHHRFSSSRQQVLIDMVIEGQAVGVIDRDLDPQLTAELLVGPIFYRRLMTATPFLSKDVPALVDAVLGPVAARTD